MPVTLLVGGLSRLISKDFSTILAFVFFFVIEVYEIKGGWAKASFGNRTGYCSTDYMKPVETSSSGNLSFRTGDEVYCLRNMHIYSAQNTDSEKVAYVLRGDKLIIRETAGDFVRIQIDGRSTEGWCKAEDLGTEDVAFIPEFSSKPSKVMFEKLIGTASYMERFPYYVASSMFLLDTRYSLPVMANDGYSAYLAKGIDSVSDIRYLFRYFFTDRCIDDNKMMDRFYEGDMGFIYNEGKYYFNENYGLGTSYPRVDRYEKLSEGKWKVYCSELVGVGELLGTSEYIIVTEDGKYKIDEIN